jgi:hypothetical protein
VPVTGTARRSFMEERTVLQIPGGGELKIGMTEDGEIKLSADRDYMIESFYAHGPKAEVESGVGRIALILAPVD